MLLTTAEVKDFEDAKQRVEWYSGRWGIEVYHRTLNTGCRIKDRQLGTADRLETCLGIDMVVAWRIYHLTMLGREIPDHPCTVFFEEVEWKALCCYYFQTPEEAPTMKQAVCMVGSIGGHLERTGVTACRARSVSGGGFSVLMLPLTCTLLLNMYRFPISVTIAEEQH